MSDFLCRHFLFTFGLSSSCAVPWLYRIKPKCVLQTFSEIRNSDRMCVVTTSLARNRSPKKNTSNNIQHMSCCRHSVFLLGSQNLGTAFRWFCPKSAKEEEWNRKREDGKRNGRGQEEGTEEEKKGKGEEEREKRKTPTGMLTVPQIRRSPGTELAHKAHFPPSGTRSSPCMK